VWRALRRIFEHSSASGAACERAKTANPRIRIVARAHSPAEVEHLRKFGADNIIVGEQEIAREMVSRLFGTDQTGNPQRWLSFSGEQGLSFTLVVLFRSLTRHKCSTSRFKRAPQVVNSAQTPDR
jgi:hypothetical protein